MGPVDDLSTYEYFPHGLLKASHEAAGAALPQGDFTRNVAFTYDSRNLYVATASSTVGRIVAGAFVPGGQVLSTSFETDLRHGKTTRTTDPNAAVSRATFDSSGRLLTRTGPDNVVLEQNVFADAFPVSQTSTITTDVGKTFQRQTQLDGEDRVLSVVEGAGTTAVPWTRKVKVRVDAFGRAVEAYLPVFVTSVGGGVTPATNGSDATVYDGFDRATLSLSADARSSSTHYEPRDRTETNARGIATTRTYDAFGALAMVYRNPGGAAEETAAHSFARDGRGEIVRVNDADGSVRRIERDGGGRVRHVTLAGLPGSTPAQFSMCHDVDDKMVRLVSPAGRVVTVTHDELGRTLMTHAEDAAGLTVDTTQTFDKTSSGAAVAGGLAEAVLRLRALRASADFDA